VATTITNAATKPGTNAATSVTNAATSVTNAATNAATGVTNYATVCSFVGDTMVYLADGSSIPIQDLQPGQVFMSYDLGTHTLYPNIVEKVLTFTVHGEWIVNGVGTDAVEVFYTRNGWMQPDQIHIGDQIFNGLTGTWDTITSLLFANKTVTVYDFIGTSGNSELVAAGYLADVTIC
jgi:hypothetical protein